MRDYKNVRVPRKYRTAEKSVNVKRVDTTRRVGRRGANATGVKSVLLNILLFIVLAGGSWLGWQVYRLIAHAEVFQISGVDMKGVRQLGNAELKDIAGVFTGRNIFRVNLEDGARRARENPWVKEVRIHRSLPNRISMTFVERAPCAILDTGSGRYVMDGEGVVIARMTKDDGSAWPLPVVEVKDYRAKSGEPVSTEGMQEALTLLSEISARGGWKLADITVKANSPETLSVVYADHEFKIGCGNYGEKLRRLSEVLADVKQRGLDIAYVDLRPERQAAVMATNSGGRQQGREKIFSIGGRRGKKT